MLKKAKTEVLRLVYSYIRRVSEQTHTPAAAAQAKAVFNNISKSDDSNNGRKMRASEDLLLMSWAYDMMKSGDLEGVLAGEPSQLDAEALELFKTALQGAVDTSDEVGKGEDAKHYRNALRTALAGMAASESTEVVCPSTNAVCTCRQVAQGHLELHVKICMHNAIQPNCSSMYIPLHLPQGSTMQGLRALYLAFIETFLEDTTMDTQRVHTMPEVKGCDSALKYADLLLWPVEWGALGDNSPESPFAFWHSDRAIPKPENQTDRALLANKEHCTLAKLLMAHGENAPAGFHLFRDLHNLLVWRVPLLDPIEKTCVPVDKSQEEAGHETDEATEDTGNDVTDVTPESLHHMAKKSVVDVEVNGPKSGYMLVAGVLMLVEMMPFVVSPLPCDATDRHSTSCCSR